MSCSRRHTANALTPLCRGQRGLAFATTSPFAGSASFSRAQVSCPCRLNICSPFQGFFRSYTPRRDPKAKTDKSDQTTDPRRSPRADYKAPQRTAGRIMPDLSGLEITDPLADLHLAWESFEPRIRFDQSQPAPKTDWDHGRAIDVYPLKGYSSDAESITIHFYGEDWVGQGDWSMELSKQYLRDICRCSKCISPSSGRKTFATCDVPAAPQLRDPDTESIKLSADGSLEITWEHDFLTGDKHISVYPKIFLNRLAKYNGRAYNPARPRRTPWDDALFTHNMESRIITYHGWMQGGLHFAQAISNLLIYGLVFMRGVPQSRHAVQGIAEKIGHLSSTIRGLTWDVISQPEEEHLEGKNQYLRLHQDLLYCYKPPRVKFLHCVKNDCQGGVSLFSDGLCAAVRLKREDMRSFKALSEQSVTYSYENAGNYLESRRRVIHKSTGPDSLTVSWSPAFQGAFQGAFRIKENPKPWLPRKTSPHDQAEPGSEHKALQVWSSAARAFRDRVESPEHVVKYRLRPGDCVIFDNSRILHGRTEVDASAGLRHLRGAYVDEETLRSATLDLVEKGLLLRDSRGMLVTPLRHAQDLYRQRVSLEMTFGSFEGRNGRRYLSELVQLPPPEV